MDVFGFNSHIYRKQQILYIYVTHLDLKDEDVKVVPEVSLEILDGTILLGQLVLRNASNMRSTIVVGPS